MRIAIGVALIVVFLAGVAIGVIATWALGFASGGRVQVLEGYAWVNQEGTAIGLSPDQDTAGEGYVIAGATWREEDGSWQDTFPTCLEPSTSDQRVRLGVMHAPPIGEAPSKPVVVWLECLETATPTDLALAREALQTFFSLLHDEHYSEALPYYGGDYQVLRDWNPDVAGDDYVTLFQNGCTVNGLQCLEIKTVVQEKEMSPGHYLFTVEFAQDDGSLFTREPSESEFDYTVRKVDGKFLVQELPVYVQ